MSNAVAAPAIPDAAEIARKEKSAKRFWVGIVVLMLGLQIAGGVGTVILATGDPTVAIIPNYHQSAINWDTTRRARQLTEKLGWTVHSSAALSPDDSSKRVLAVSVTDAENAPVDRLNIHAKVFHHAAGREVFTMKMQSLGQGHYSAPTSLTRTGLWQVDLRIEGEHGIAASSTEMHVR